MPNRLALVQTLIGPGPITLHEAARRVGRNVRAVHSDVHMLLQAGVLRKDDRGRIEFPYNQLSRARAPERIALRAHSPTYEATQAHPQHAHAPRQRVLPRRRS